MVINGSSTKCIYLSGIGELNKRFFSNGYYHLWYPMSSANSFQLLHYYVVQFSIIKKIFVDTENQDGKKHFFLGISTYSSLQYK